MTWDVQLSSRARKELKAVKDRRMYHRLTSAMKTLGADPRPAGCKKLKGREDEWRIRVGDWRIVYEARVGELIVLVLMLGPRGGV